MKNIFNKLKKGFGITEEKGVNDPQLLTHNDTATPFIPATAAMRESVTGFIIQSLQAYVDERSQSVAGLHFYIVCNGPQEEEAARIALYMDKPGMFRAEYLERKLLNHFIQVEPGWFFESEVVKDKLPEGCVQKGNFGLKVIRLGEQPVITQYSKAFIQVLVGQAECSEYVLDPHKQMKYHIGRSRAPQLFSGKIQQNDIVFISRGEPGFDELTGHANLQVSRNHAYIVYDAKAGYYLLFPDRGGLPDSGNKLKVHTTNDKVKSLNIYGVAHCLRDGDQVILGEGAVLQFTIVPGK